MQSTRQDFAETYRNISDDEIATLHAEVGSLTDEARAALQAEIQRRGISITKLHHLNTAVTQREAKFDRRQKQHEKDVGSYLLSRALSRDFWVLVSIVLVLLSAVISALISHHH